MAESINKRKFLLYLSYFIFRPAQGKTSIPLSPAANKPLFRGTAGRNTFHGGHIRDRRQFNQYNGPGVPGHTQDTTTAGQVARVSFLNKLTSKFSRR